MSALPHSDHEAIEEEAARWVMRRDEAGWSDRDQMLLDEWLARSMAHKAAFWRVDFGWRHADRLASLGDTVGRPPARFAATWLGHHLAPMGIAASLLCMLSFFATQLYRDAGSPLPERQVLATKVGGHSVVPLDDGSKIELNTATTIRAAVANNRREVWLDQGEAYFEVKHSNVVPFVVYAGPKTITVLGTKFSVRRDDEKVTVSVVEGRVRVEDSTPRPQGTGSSVITTGDVAITDSGSTLVAAKSPERVETGLAWRDGMLAFDQKTIGEAAAEFNRYNDKKLVIADPQVAAIRIGGSFRASNVDAFVRLLHDAYGLDAKANGNHVQVGN